MIINYLNILRTRRCPSKTDSKAIVYSNAMLTKAIALKDFQPITRRNPQIINACGYFKLSQLTQSDALEWQKASHPFSS